jgi:hypothetical protein
MTKFVAWLVVVIVIASLTLTFIAILVQSDLRVDLMAFTKIVFSWATITGALGLLGGRIFRDDIKKFLNK